MPRTLSDVLLDLHEHGAINVDTPLSRLVGEDTLAALAGPSAAASTTGLDIVVGHHYVFVTYSDQAASLTDVTGAADEVRAATGQPSPSGPSVLPAAQAGTFSVLSDSGLIKLDAPLRSLMGPGGSGGIIVADITGVQTFLTSHFVFVHVSGNVPAETLGETAAVAGEVTKAIGG
jgi:hypothetical protein